ncbi:PucR family transcriptional regulator [Nocardia sp. NPDC059180]|uniref:PucR family transcriptional regulator n=1 Tax=Nocardia sp. NPDC059180 TaxID=3346761 RepID=UPI00369E0C16
MQAQIPDTALAMLHDRAIAVVDRFAAELPLYEGLPQSLIEGDFLHGSRLNVELFFAYLRTGRLPDESDTREIVDLAAGRVRDGAPLAEVLNNYRIGAHVVRSQLAESGSDEDAAILRETAEPLIEYLLTVTGRIAVAAAEGAQEPGWEQRERLRVVADALLSGTDPGEWLPGSPTPIGTAFHVVVFRVGDGDPAALTELRNAIDAAPGSFVRMDRRGWTALLPWAEPVDEEVPGSLAELVPKFAARTDCGWWAGVARAATRAEIPAAFAEARVLAELGRCLERSEPVCLRRELPLEYTLARSGAACADLAAVLNPLDDQQQLAQTLDLYLDTDFNQLGTARALYVHRNTVTYRLARIHELTGFDPASAAGAVQLAAARTARRIRGGHFGE